MFRKIRANIPNTITCLNLLCGATACIFTFSYDLRIGGLYGYEWVWIFIGAAALFDFFDGAAARLLHAYSDLGKELDSLSDLISFGLAPSLLMFNLFALNHGGELCWWNFTALLIAVFGALRLARFNIDNSQQTTFRGLPIPANAIFWIGFTAWTAHYGYPGNWITLALIVAVSLMMMSPMEMFSLKFKNFGIAENLRRYLLIGAAVILFLTTGIPGLGWSVVLYVVMSAFTSRTKS